MHLLLWWILQPNMLDYQSASSLCSNNVVIFSLLLSCCICVFCANSSFHQTWKALVIPVQLKNNHNWTGQALLHQDGSIAITTGDFFGKNQVAAADSVLVFSSIPWWFDQSNLANWTLEIAHHNGMVHTIDGRNPASHPGCRIPCKMLR